MTTKPTLETVQSQLGAQDYVADDEIHMAVYLAAELQKPLLVEGPAGVGKTEIAKSLARKGASVFVIASR